MTLGPPNPRHPQASYTDAAEKASQAESERIIRMTVVEILAFAVGVGAAINFLFYALPRRDKAQIVYACAAVIIFATIGVAAHLLARLPIGVGTGDATADALRKLADQNAESFKLANQQWIETRNWSARLIKRPEGTEQIQFSFELWNPSAIAVTMKKTNVDVTSLDPFVVIQMDDPEPQMTVMVDTTTNEFIDTGIPPGPQHIRVPIDRSPDPRIERYSGDPNHPFQSKLHGGPPTGSPISPRTRHRRGETILQGMVLAPNGHENLGGGFYDLDTPDKVAHFETGRLRISFNITLEYIDAFDRPRERRFLMVGTAGRPIGLHFGPLTAMDHMPGKDIFGRPVNDEKEK